MKIPILSLVAIFCFFLIISCTDEDVSTNLEDEKTQIIDSLVGNWFLFQSAGGFPGIQDRTDDSIRLSFNVDGKYFSYIKDSLLRNDDFSVYYNIDTSFFNDMFILRLDGIPDRIEENDSEKVRSYSEYFLCLDKDTLILTHHSKISNFYKKIK